MPPVIRVENLGKKYSLGQKGGSGNGYRRFSEELLDALKRPFRRTNHHSTNDSKLQAPCSDFWALRDVSFEVQEGEVLGIIGRNGAGKSTLLKVLSRITEPTEGRVTLNGRVASLLEVGTGFHPELTGRENIFLNGAILGMSREEIRRKFDEIVAFAEVERFLDTPVKRYSSGMYVRLAFAVAAHLDPEILIVDEVLAVGDLQFQSKCLGKMGEVAHGSRTVLFVSHNMGAISELCSKSILLTSGRLDRIGATPRVIRDYLSRASDLGSDDLVAGADHNVRSPFVVTRCWVTDEDDRKASSVNVGRNSFVNVELAASRRVAGAEISIRISNSLGQAVTTTNLSDCVGPTTFDPGTHKYRVLLPRMFLCPDLYSLTICIHEPNVHVYDLREHAVRFRVEETGSPMWRYRGSNHGVVLSSFCWEAMPTLGARHTRTDNTGRQLNLSP